MVGKKSIVFSIWIFFCARNYIDTVAQSIEIFKRKHIYRILFILLHVTLFLEKKCQYSRMNLTFWLLTFQPTGLDSSSTHCCTAGVRCVLYDYSQVYVTIMSALFYSLVIK